MKAERLVPFLILAVLLPCLAQSDTKLKIKGLREYAKQGSSAIPKITPYLEDGDSEVRREAVRALVDIGTQRSLEPLTAACRDNDPEVQMRATDGLVNFYLPGYVEHGFSASLKRAGNKLAGKWTDSANEDAVEPDTPLRPEIVKALSDLAESGSSMDARANAARALGILRAKGGVPALTQSLKSKDSRLIFESLIALQKIQDRSAGPRAIFLVRDLDEDIQVTAIETVGLLGAKEAVPDLKRVLEKSPGKRVRRATLFALAHLADPDSRQTFLSLMNDKDDEVRAAAAEGLGRIGNSEDRPALERAWDSERRMSPRLAVAFALAMIGNREVSDFSPMGYLINTLNQKSWRGIAQPYLSELAKRPEPRQAVVSAVGRISTRDEKTGIAQVLAGCGSKDAVPPLEQLAKDDDPAVAREALRALRIVRGSVQ